jgi:hypothetical protein
MSRHFTTHSSVSIAIRLWAGRSRNRGSILSKVRRFLLFHKVQTGCSVHPISYTTSTGGISLGVIQTKREADHSPPPNAEVKNTWGIHSRIRLEEYFKDCTPLFYSPWPTPPQDCSTYHTVCTPLQWLSFPWPTLLPLATREKYRRRQPPAR